MLELTGRISRANELAGSTSGINRMQGQIQGIRGEKGDKGEQGVGIASVALNQDYTLTITLTDETSYTTSSIRGERGERGEQGVQGVQGVQGIQGDTGNGISSVTKTGTQGLVDTYTITFTDGTTTTFTVTNGRNGAGSVADVLVNGVSVLDGDTAKVVTPTKVSDLTNDSGFVEETDLADVATTGDYDDLINTPTNVSDLTNDANYQNATQVSAAVEDAIPIIIEFSTFSSLPQTQTDSRITADMVRGSWYYTNPSAITSDVTVTTSAGSVTISGSMSGSTALTLELHKARN